MAEHPNATRARKLAQDFIARDIPSILEALSPTCTWRVPGKNSLAGVLRGHEGVQTFFSRIYEQPNDTASESSIELEDVLASDDRVVFFLRVTADTPEGQAATRIAYFATVGADGKLDKNWFLPSDLALSDRILN